MSELSLVLTYSLIIIAMILSYKGKVSLEKDLLIGSVRAVIQLSLIGVVLKYVFEIDNYFLTTVILIGMVYNATMVAAKRRRWLTKSENNFFCRYFKRSCSHFGDIIIGSGDKLSAGPSYTSQWNGGW